eukprot:TRINITY_DN11544_c0_g1::TRINITY_DN11544_c0_g1_i1::g.22110::m.22110 TRINITY_DN11544_c0_g1::TRINITY_DN11544_c0_g1_i1::g.22110  ORF type:complete len:158 (-),score=39.26,sp/Q5DM57/IF172_CHLRE/40.67/6e-26,TPR_7/PF13176.1/0.24,TPR_7/PF13176.1/23,TPR_7/PF13176.1/7,SNAP/PF14938.1/1.3e+02,SNAP/PF14938.1/0.2,SNAP/PF14938.1/9.2,Clathrin/PF00637.15/4.9e+02,Clathrin/PF00637.15/0.003,Nic96/PF04097.9/0.021,MIT/PF04212.13/9.4,MIT/PF04212.13/15,TPR_2/PF07719.12/7.5,TPR_2/PF07719.12/8.6e+03,TPR_2/PF07719.12/1.3e+
MYEDTRSWTDALRVAKDYLPQKVPDLNARVANFMSMGGAQGADLMSPGRMWEEAGDYSKAIDSYLAITVEKTNNYDLLEQIWENAVKLAMDHVHDRANQVVETVAKRFVEINRHAQAAELYEGISAYKEAIDIYIQGGLWDKAKNVCINFAPSTRTM